MSRSPARHTRLAAASPASANRCQDARNSRIVWNSRRLRRRATAVRPVRSGSAQLDEAPAAGGRTGSRTQAPRTSTGSTGSTAMRLRLRLAPRATRRAREAVRTRLCVARWASARSFATDARAAWNTGRAGSSRSSCCSTAVGSRLRSGSAASRRSPSSEESQCGASAGPVQARGTISSHRMVSPLARGPGSGVSESAGIESAPAVTDRRCRLRVWRVPGTVVGVERLGRSDDVPVG